MPLTALFSILANVISTHMKRPLNLRNFFVTSHVAMPATTSGGGTIPIYIWQNSGRTCLGVSGFAKGG